MLWRCCKYLIGKSIPSERNHLYYSYLHFLVLIRNPWPRIVSKYLGRCYAFTYSLSIIIITVTLWNRIMCIRIFSLSSLQPNLLNFLDFAWNFLMLFIVSTQLWATASLECVCLCFLFVPYYVYSPDFLETMGRPMKFLLWLTRHKDRKVLWVESYVTWNCLILKSLTSGHLLLKHTTISNSGHKKFKPFW